MRGTLDNVCLVVACAEVWGGLEVVFGRCIFFGIFGDLVVFGVHFIFRFPLDFLYYHVLCN